MQRLERDLHKLCKRNRDGSYMTQAQRQERLQLAARQLSQAGFHQLSARGLKPKHVEHLLSRWRAEELSIGTIKNRMSDLRWWAEKVGKPGVIARSNDHYGIDRRIFVTNQSKARTFEEKTLEKIEDEHVRMSLRLQSAFGLRREESIKFKPSYALYNKQPKLGETIRLKPSWTKGGKAREIPIRTKEQLEVLNQVRELASAGSLIPADRTYIQQRRLYDRQAQKAGLSKLHGLRHTYAQQRYQQLTGWSPPAQGGPTTRDLTPTAKQKDHKARLQISRELGHEREQITAVYLGR